MPFAPFFETESPRTVTMIFDPGTEEEVTVSASQPASEASLRVEKHASIPGSDAAGFTRFRLQLPLVCDNLPAVHAALHVIRRRRRRGRKGARTMRNMLNRLKTVWRELNQPIFVGERLEKNCTSSPPSAS